MKPEIIISKIQNRELDAQFTLLYGAQQLADARKRYINAIEEYIKLYGNNEVELFSVPGRTEICGNHTDHNNGKVLAAAVDLDIIAVAGKTDDAKVRITSKGYSEDAVDLTTIDSVEVEKGHSLALVTGMCAVFKKAGFNIGGFNAYTTSRVASGSGLSSSAAFEVMCGNMINHLYNDGKVSLIEIAKLSQKAENEYFGKPCGLMDQTACAVGGFVYIDFEEPKQPVVEKIEFSFTDAGYNLCITNTGGSHADLTEDYASIPAEMKKVAGYFGKKVLREVESQNIYENILSLRAELGDRALLRSIHFYNENKRVEKAVAALKEKNINKFFETIGESGKSSAQFLQNVYTNKKVEEQGISLALAISDKFLTRVHGGGFAGTVQSYIPNAKTEEFKNIMEKAFGKNSCCILNIRNEGAIKFNI